MATVRSKNQLMSEMIALVAEAEDLSPEERAHFLVVAHFAVSDCAKRLSETSPLALTDAQRSFEREMAI